MRIMVVVEGGQSGVGRLHQLTATDELRMDVTAPTDVMERLAENRYDVVKALLTGLEE